MGLHPPAGLLEVWICELTRRAVPGTPISGFIFCSHQCSHANGKNSTKWKPCEYMESENSLLNSIAA